ncbi:MAG: fibronectin type III domain-containing protein, partial [Methylococcales bacterium]|nr:fibronectin type III domain-containing protein [Methylococcales bacterium]
MKNSIKKILCLGLISSLIVLAGCKGKSSETSSTSQSVGNTGSIAVKVVWQQTSIQNISKAVTLPTDVVTMRAIVTGDGLTTMQQDFTASNRKGTINNVPVGSNRKVTLKGLNVNETVIFQGERTNLSVTKDTVTDAGELVLAEVTNKLPSFSASTSTTASSTTTKSNDEYDAVAIMGQIHTINTFSDFTDEDGKISSINWEQTSGASVTLNDSSVANPVFTAPNTIGNLTFKVTVVDDRGGSSTGVTTIFVNVAPVANAGLDKNVLISSSVALEGSATDSNGAIESFSWSQISGESVTLSGTSDDPNPSFTTPTVAGDLVFRLTATDNDFSSSTDEVAISVKTILPPTSLTLSSDTSNRVTLSWISPGISNAEFGKAVGIAVARKVGATGIYSVIGSVPVDETSYEDTGLSPNTTYFYKLYTYTSYLTTNISDYTSEESVSTVSFSSVPNSPTNLTVSDVNGWTVDLSWSDNSSNEDGFVVERSADGGNNFSEITRLNANVTSYRDDMVSENKTYHYRIKAFNNIAESSFLQSTNITTGAVSVTELSGGAATNTTLSLANSPYLVTSDYVLAADNNLVIEAGVHIRFEASTSLEIRGALTAVGTVSKPIVFTAKDPSSASKGAWSGVSIRNQLGGSGIFQYVELSYSSGGVSVECCNSGGPVEIYDSVFDNNSTASSNYSGWDQLMYRSVFINNNTVIKSADKIIAYSKFVDNQFGLNSTQRISVYFSTFRKHTNVALSGGGGSVKYCTITENVTGISRNSVGSTFSLSFNIIANNTGDGIKHSGSSLVNNNNIFNNGGFNMVNNNSDKKDATKNWWGSAFSTDIDQKIFDFYDDSSLGI